MSQRTSKLLPMIGMLTQNEPQPYFTGEAKPDAITENSTPFICIRTADDALIGKMVHKASSVPDCLL